MRGFHSLVSAAVTALRHTLVQSHDFNHSTVYPVNSRKSSQTWRHTRDCISSTVAIYSILWSKKISSNYMPLWRCVGLYAIHTAVIDKCVTVCGFYVLACSETADRTLLQKAAEQIQRNFAGQEDFLPTNLFIATWDGVGHYDEKYDQVSVIIFF